MLYLGESCSSMFVYCTRVLHLSEHAAYDRIEAARLARRLPEVLAKLADGSLTLASLRLLAPHLTAASVEGLLREAAYKSKREIEQLVARLRPQPPVPSTVRKLPESTPPIVAINPRTEVRILCSPLKPPSGSAVNSRPRASR